MLSVREKYWRYSLFVLIAGLGLTIFAELTPFLGGLLGLLQGSLNLYLVCIGLKLLFYLLGGMKYCNQGIILDTLVLSKLYTLDPLSLFVS